jgi:hypothetical protein
LAGASASISNSIIEYDSTYGSIVKVCMQRLTRSWLTLLQRQSVPEGTTSQFKQFQINSQDFCTSFWNAALAYPPLQLTQAYSNLLSKGFSSDLKPCVIISLSAQSKL